MDEEALLEWLGGKTYRKLKRKDKVKKISERADDDNGNDDKSSQDYIPMEKISREFVKIKNKRELKKMDKGINDALDLQEKPRSEAKVELPQEAAMDEPANEFIAAKAHYDKLKSAKLLREQIAKNDPDYKPSQAEQKRAKQASASADLDEDKQIAKDIADEEAATKGAPTEVPKVSIKPKAAAVAPQLTALQPPGASNFEPQAPVVEPKGVDNAQQANPLEQPTSTANPSSIVPAARTPSLVGQLPPTETQPIADIPGGNGELKGVEANDPASSRVLPLNLDIPVSDGTEPDAKSSTLSDLSADYQRAVSKPISLLGQSIDPASKAYEAADRAIAPLQLMNNGLTKLPTSMARLANFVNYPLDKLAGTDAFGKNNKLLDSADNFIDSFGVTRAATNPAERAFEALGMLALPNPMTMLAPVGAAVGVSANEGIYQTAEALKHYLTKNPPVDNKYGELEPRVTSVSGPQAKQLQKQVDADAATFLPKFSEANYGDGLAYAAGAAVVIAGLYKGRNYLKSPVAGRTILNAEKPIAEQLPESAVTAGEALRTINQNANFVLESQAERAGNIDLVHDIATQTRAGMAARVENMVETGRVAVPGYEFQLGASPKELMEFHLSRPQAEQEEVSKALHVMSQVDDAKLHAERRAAVKAAATDTPPDTATTDIAPTSRLAEKPEQPYSTMPPEPDIQAAQAVLARPENQGIVRAMNEIRIADANAKKAAGFWDEETTGNMLSKRPNYVRRVETHDYNIVDGRVVPKTRMQSMIDSLKTKRGQDDYITEGTDLSSALERGRINSPNQMLDAVIANVHSLQETVIKAHENDVVKRFYQSIKDHPELSKSIKTLEKGEKVPKGFDTASFYDGGKKTRFAVDPLTAKALRFEPTSVASRYNIANQVRNAFQAATTGPILAPFFAGTSFTMEASIGAMSRSRSLRVGNIDAAVQAGTGGRVGAPGDMLGTMAAGVGAIRRAQRADNLLHNIQKTEKYLLQYGNQSLKDLEEQMPGFTSKLAKGLTVGQDATLESIINENRQLYQQSAKGWALRNGALHSSQNELLRNANKFYTKDVLHSFQRQLGHEEGFSWYNWYKNLILNVHDAGRLVQVEQNMGRADPKKLAYETRRFSGDLGVRGLGNYDSSYILSNDVSKAAQLGTKALTNKAVGSILDLGYASIPYINPHIQGTTRFLEQLARQPTSTIAGVLNSTTLPFLGTLAATAAMGPQYLDYLLNKREEYKKTGYWYVPIPGLPPEAGLDFRIDPVLAPFGYPIIEAMDSVFGIRKFVAQAMNRKAPAAETQGLMSALQEGVKEAVGFGFPIQASLALASQGIASRNMIDPTYATRTEQASKIGTGKNPGSALSVPMQMMLESMLGATAQHAIAGMDSFVSAGRNDSKLAAAVKGAGFSFASKIPVAGTMFTGKSFNESSTALANNTRQLTNSAKKITTALDNVKNGLLKSANSQAGEGDTTPQIKMGNAGVISLPPEVQQKAEQLHSLLAANPQLKGINSERSAISTSLAGLRGINAGNLARHLVVPLKEGRTIGGLNYMILNEELLKQELAKEDESIIKPKMTPGGATRAPKVAKRQRALIIQDLTDDVPKVSKNGKISNQDDEYYKPATLKQVQSLKNALNERRYKLDLDAAQEYEKIEGQLGVKLNTLAAGIKLTPELEASVNSD